MKFQKAILTFLIINGLFIDCFSQQWRVFTTSNSPLPSNIIGGLVVDTNNVKWIGTTNGLVRIDGNNWIVYDTTNTPLGTNGIYPFALDSLNNIWCILTSRGIAKYDGFNWTIYNTSNSGLITNNIIYITIDSKNIKWTGPPLLKFDDNNWTIYSSTNSGLPHNSVVTVATENHIKWIGMASLSAGVARFNDTGWVVYNTSNSGLPSNVIRYIRVDNANNKWICTNFGGLAKFNSNINQWSVYNTGNSGMPSDYCNGIVFKQHFKYIGTDQGLAKYNDTTWQVFNTSNSPLPNNSTTRVEIDSLGNLWIPTGNGLAVYNENGIIGINNKANNLPRGFILYQNYPNPFNPETIIKYDIPKEDFVSIKIYDDLGRELYKFAEFKKAGSYEVKFDGSNFASGIYFYRLVVGDNTNNGGFTDSKKMVLIK